MSIRVAVIGAAGHIGSAIVEELEANPGFHPVALVRNDLVARMQSLRCGDVRVGSASDRRDADRVLGDCDAVINCALPRGPSREVRRINEAIVDQIARQPRVRAVVQFSTVAVYGSRIGSDPGVVRPRPETSYGRAKLDLERYARRACAAAGLRYYVLRLGHVYGAGQWVSQQILEDLTRAEFGLPEDGGTPSNAVWVGHIASVVRRILVDEPLSGTYDLTDTPNKTWRELYDLHSQIFGLPHAPPLPKDAAAMMRCALAGGTRTATLLRQSLRQIVNGSASAFVEGASDLRQIIEPALTKLPALVEERLRRVHVRSKVKAELSSLPPRHRHLPA
ncbi:MAG: NAD(P)-dependent oxidoreductase, partial [Gammaproteobacteria bacterium]